MTRIATWNTARDVWETEAVSLLSGRSDVYSETFMISGSMRNGVVYELPTSAHRMDGSASLFSQPGGKLLPSPVAQPSGNSPEDHLRKKPGREVVTDLAIIVENGLLETGGRLLKTPTAQLAINGGSQHPDKRKSGGHGPTLADEVEHLLPTPNTMEHLPVRTGEARERARYRGDMNGSRRERAGNLRERVVEELEPVLSPQFCMGGTDWGPYAAAIARWESVLGRPAPAPTEEGPKGGRRLSSLLVEWMMGLPEGWVTGHGLPRTAELKMLGNGVVPQQAIYALTLMGAHEGV